MATARRVFWETVFFFGFLLVIGGLVLWSGRRTDSVSVRLTAEYEEALGRRDADHLAELEELREAAAEAERQHAEREARAVFRSFVAASRTAIEARWGSYLADAAEDLSRLPEVEFVRVMTPTGGRLSSAGKVGDESDPHFSDGIAWALEATALETRPGRTTGIVELAAPVEAGGRPIAYVWLGYDIRQSVGAGNSEP
jgi:hypothetical protein